MCQQVSVFYILNLFLEQTMKKFFLGLVALAALVAVTSCGSLRTPSASPRTDKVWYNTFFGISIESLVCGDELLVK